MNLPKHDATTPTKLVVRVLQDLVAAARFEDYGALAEALKRRCAALKVPYDAGLVSAAIDQLDRGGRTPLIPSSLPRVHELVERPPDGPIVSRTDAAQILATLRARLGSVQIKTIQPVRRVTPFDQDKQKAKRILAAEIVASIARCEALEDEHTT